MLTILFAFGSNPASGVNPTVPLPLGATPLLVPLPVDRTLPLGAAMAANLTQAACPAKHYLPG